MVKGSHKIDNYLLCSLHICTAKRRGSTLKAASSLETHNLFDFDKEAKSDSQKIKKVKIYEY